MTITPVDSVVTAVAWGGVTAAGIMAGALLGIFARLTHGAIARSMSVGAGLLLAAASVELAAEVLKVAPYKGILALLIGATAFSAGNAWLSGWGAQEMATGSDHDKLSLHKERTFKGVTFLSLNTYF